MPLGRITWRTGSDTKEIEVPGRHRVHGGGAEFPEQTCSGTPDCARQHRNSIQEQNRERNGLRAVRGASGLVRSLAERIGFLENGGDMPRTLHRHQWSVFDVTSCGRQHVVTEIPLFSKWWSTVAATISVPMLGESIGGSAAAGSVGQICQSGFTAQTANLGLWKAGHDFTTMPHLFPTARGENWTSMSLATFSDSRPRGAAELLAPCARKVPTGSQVRV